MTLIRTGSLKNISQKSLKMSSSYQTSDLIQRRFKNVPFSFRWSSETRRIQENLEFKEKEGKKKGNPTINYIKDNVEQKSFKGYDC